MSQHLTGTLLAALPRPLRLYVDDVRRINVAGCQSEKSPAITEKPAPLVPRWAYRQRCAQSRETTSELHHTGLAKKAALVRIYACGDNNTVVASLKARAISLFFLAAAYHGSMRGYNLSCPLKIT
eukprot:scaffold647880_cov47-Prasinocladus_malaysianus.AAC.1